jgi:hypothetical protein
MSIDKAFAPATAATPGSKVWQIRCEDCDPEPGGYFWFSLDQCDTPAKALECIIQLNEQRCTPIVLQSFIDLVEELFGRASLPSAFANDSAIQKLMSRDEPHCVG